MQKSLVGLPMKAQLVSAWLDQIYYNIELQIDNTIWLYIYIL